MHWQLKRIGSIVPLEVRIVIPLRSLIADYSDRGIIKVEVSGTHRFIHVIIALPPASAYHSRGSRSGSRLSSTLATVPRRGVDSSLCTHFACFSMFGTLPRFSLRGQPYHSQSTAVLKHDAHTCSASIPAR